MFKNLTIVLALSFLAMTDPSPSENRRQARRNLKAARHIVAFRRHLAYAARRSALPMRPGKLRNQPCPCGSGRKYKRCCGKE